MPRFDWLLNNGQYFLDISAINIRVIHDYQPKPILLRYMMYPIISPTSVGEIYPQPYVALMLVTSAYYQLLITFRHGCSTGPPFLRGWRPRDAQQGEEIAAEERCEETEEGTSARPWMAPRWTTVAMPHVTSNRMGSRFLHWPPFVLSAAPTLSKHPSENQSWYIHDMFPNAKPHPMVNNQRLRNNPMVKPP